LPSVSAYSSWTSVSRKRRAVARVRPVDLLGLAVVPALLGAVFALPEPTRRSLAFETASAPQASYELTDSPGNRLVEGFRRSAGVMSARSPRWLVDFDPRLLGEIRNALGSADSGADVVIEQNGRVRVDAAAAP